MFNALLNAFFPQACTVCGSMALDHKTAPLCVRCWRTIEAYRGPKCRICGKPLRSGVATACGDCLKQRPAFVYARSFGLYKGALREALNMFKYHGIRRLSGPLSRLVPDDMLPAAGAVVPVPLSGRRLKLREFNQSALIAKDIAERTGAELITGSLVKTVDTRPQVGLSAGRRTLNIKNAFSVRDAGALAGKEILLVDDVMTTGATVRECSRTLRKAGAGAVYVITLAHGIRD